MPFFLNTNILNFFGNYEDVDNCCIDLDVMYHHTVQVNQNQLCSMVNLVESFIKHWLFSILGIY